MALSPKFAELHAAFAEMVEHIKQADAATELPAMERSLEAAHEILKRLSADLASLAGKASDEEKAALMQLAVQLVEPVQRIATIANAMRNKPRPRWSLTGQWTVVAPGKLVNREIKPGDDKVTLVATYDDGTVITSTMHNGGSIDVDINRNGLVVDEEKREIRVVKD